MAEKKPPKKTATKAKTAPKTVIGGRTIGMRGRVFTGVVTSDLMARTVTVEWQRRKYVPKYQRYEKRRTKIKAHNDIGAKKGDTVEIKETRPISKTKNFMVTRIIGK